VHVIGHQPDLLIQRRQIRQQPLTSAHPSRSGAAVTARTSTDPGDVCRGAARTDGQNRCGSRSPRPADTHAARSYRTAAGFLAVFSHKAKSRDRERQVPLGTWAEDATLAYISQYPPRPLALPWESLTGPMQPVKILFRWPTDDFQDHFRSCLAMTTR